MEVTLMLISFESYTKMKFGQILVCCMAKFPLCFWLNAGDWKLVLGPFMILLK